MPATNPPQSQIDVRTLAAFHFCRNAGQIAFHRQGFEVERPSFRIPNLGYIPFFDPKKLQQRIADLKTRLPIWGILILVEISLVIYLARIGFPIYALLATLATAPAFYFSYVDVDHLARALEQWHAYKTSLPMPLPEIADRPIHTNWWSILKLDYAVLFPRDYCDDSSQLVGRPWRLLLHQQTGERIPVLQHYESFGNTLIEDTALKYQLQLAACARLIETHEPGIVRWGVVVDSKSMGAYVLPLSRSVVDKVSGQAKLAHLELTSLTDLQLLQPPPGACMHCPLSSPRLRGRTTSLGARTFRPFYYHLYDTLDWWSYFASESNDSSVVREDQDEEDYGYAYDRENYQTSFEDWLKRSRHQPPPRHSECGDVFQWTPTHAYWEQRQIIARRAYNAWLERNR